MLAQYDEDLRNNSFYKEILNHHQDIVDKAVEEGWVLCIPREGSATTCITIDDILDHILVPDIDLPASHYSTLSKKRVVVQNKLISLKSHNACQNTIQILFEETFYNADMHRYTVWCIERPLNGKACYDEINDYDALVTLQDCIEFLCITTGDTVLSNIQALCRNFVVEHTNFNTYTSELQKQLLQKLLTQCVEKANCRNDKQNFKIAVETCMQNYLKDVIMSAIATCVSKEEAEFNKIVQNLGDVEYKDLEIPSAIGDHIFKAKCELNKINKYTTVLGKMFCLRNTFDILSQSASQLHQFTSDDLLQILVYLIIKLQVNNWIANLKFITEFRFTSSDVSDENSFLIASLEAAVLYLKNGSIFDDILDKANENTMSVLVKNADFDQMEDLLRNDGNRDILLCHPLCSCNKCESLMENQATVNEKGQNLLHIAVLYNKVDVVEFLIEKGCNVNVVDHANDTPLHSAAKKGYQNILLYLLQNGAKADATNADGNTPLHVAVNNGHERCVKALIYCSKTINVNASNNWGNTPLHLASKWGYTNIVNILIESGALIDVNNCAKLTPRDVALNYFICKALHCDNSQIVPLKVPQKLDEPCPARKHQHGIRPKSVEQQKKLELLLKAIENNDMPLTCFYLGFPTPSTSSTNKDNAQYHHPLCTCEHCQNFLDSLSFEEQQKEQCNINMCNAEGYTPLHIAAKYGRTDILRLLLDAGAVLNVKTFKSLYTPLHLACLHQRLGVVRELLKCGGCNVDVQDARGNTPLFYACSKNDVRVFELLLSHGADVKVKNYDSVTVLYEAERKMLCHIIKLLKGFKKGDDSVADELFV